MVEDLTQWIWKATTVLWRGANRSLPTAILVAPSGKSYPVYDVSSLFPDTLERKRPRSKIKGHVLHHDGVLFSGLDANYDGHTLDESLTRMSASYNHALSQGWGVYPYHAQIDLEGRIFIARKDVLDTRRAHVAGYDPATGEVFNETRIGVCIMGNYADAKDPLGKPINMDADRPPTEALNAADAFMQMVTDLEQRSLELHPHKYFGRFPGQDWKPCPGDTWVGDEAWSGDPNRTFLYEPSKPATPAPQPAPPPATTGQVDLALVINGKRVERGPLISSGYDPTTNADVYRRQVEGGWVVVGIPRK